MLIEKRLHAGIVVLGSAGCNKPDVVTQKLVVSQRRHCLAKLILISLASGTALPAIVAFEVIPRTDIATRTLRIEVLIHAEPIAHAGLFLLFAPKQAATLLSRSGGRRSRRMDGLELLLRHRRHHISRINNGKRRLCRDRLVHVDWSRNGGERIHRLGRRIGQVKKRRPICHGVRTNRRSHRRDLS